MSFLAKLENWFSKKEDQAEVVATEFEQYAAKKIHVLVADIAALAEKIGIPLLEEAITKGGLAAALALATGPAAAGQAFLAAAGAVVQAEAPDALHALAGKTTLRQRLLSSSALSNGLFLLYTFKF